MLHRAHKLALSSRAGYTLRVSESLYMDDALVLLTSYFNLANGRRQDTADTFRVDPSLPSRTSPDGTAALYIVTESSTGGNMGPRVRRLAADTIAWEYSAHGDEQPAARLKAAMRAAHEAVTREFDGHVSVGASCIAVEHRDVYLAQVAPAQVYVLHEGSLHSIFASLDGSTPFSHALGATDGPKITVFRDEIAPGDVLSLCSSWFHRSADPDELRECFGAGSADDIADCLQELARQHDVRDAQVIVIEAALASELDVPLEDEPQGFMEQLDVAVQALANVGRMVMNELRPQSSGDGSDGHDRARPVASNEPAATRATPGRSFTEQSTTETLTVEPEPEYRRGDWDPDNTAAWDLNDFQREEARGAHPVTREHPTEEVQAVPADLPGESGEWDEREQGEAEYGFEPEADYGLEPAASVPIEETFTQPAPEREPARPTELDEVNSRIQNDSDMGDAIPPVQTFADTSTVEPSRIYATSKDIQAVNRRPRRFGGISRPAKNQSASAPVLRPGLSDIDLRKPVNRPAPPAIVWLTAAAVLLFAVVAAFYLLRHRHSPVATDPYPAKFAHNIALALSSPSTSTQDAYLTKAGEDITLARAAGDPPADLRRLQTRLTAATNTVYHVTVEASPTLIARFQQPAELAVSPDTIYVLDAAKKAVFSVPPNTNSSPTEIIQSGEPDSGFTFGTPTHIATSGSTALAFDGQTLVRDTAGTKTATSLSPGTPGEQIVAMANFGPDVYLLDAANKQVWRYPDAVQGYNPVASGFFSSTPSSVSNLVSFVLDDKDLFLLKSNGQILKFDTQQATQQPFNTILRTPFQKADDIFTDVGLPYLWVADPGNHRIVQLNKATGAYVRSYVSTNTGLDLSRIKGIAVPPSGKTLYVLTNSALYGFPVTP